MKKKRRYKSDELRRAAQGQTCVLCKKSDTDTTVLAHLPGSFYGMPAGMGQKTHDWLGAHLCLECHARMDSEWRMDAQMRMKALCLTLERLFDEEVITVSQG